MSARTGQPANPPRLVWRLRHVMATHGMFATTELIPLLAERGVHLSASQVHRVVTGRPERLNLHLLAALCDVLGCTASDLLVRAVGPEVRAGH